MDKKIYEYGGSESELKAVQINLEDGPFLVVGYMYHGDLLDTFLKEKEIPYKEIKLSDHNILFPSIHAEPSSRQGQPFYNASGMGKVEKEGSNIILYGSSIGYNDMTPDPEHAKELNKHLSGIEIKIRE